MSIFKIYMEMLLIASQYCLMFLFKKYVITISSSITGKLFSKIVIVFLILK